jgi:hypothetical protein
MYPHPLQTSLFSVTTLHVVRLASKAQPLGSSAVSAYPFLEHKMFCWLGELSLFLCLVNCLFLYKISLLGYNLLCRSVSPVKPCPTYNFWRQSTILCHRSNAKQQTSKSLAFLWKCIVFFSSSCQYLLCHLFQDLIDPMIFQCNIRNFSTREEIYGIEMSGLIFDDKPGFIKFTFSLLF